MVFLCPERVNTMGLLLRLATVYLIIGLGCFAMQLLLIIVELVRHVGNKIAYRKRLKKREEDNR